MFKKNIIIKGKHAYYMKKLTSFINTDTKQKIFERNIDVYILAPIVGMVYNRIGKNDPKYKDDTSIHTEQLQREIDILTYNYRLVMLLGEKDELSLEERMNRAFRYDNNDEKRKAGDQLFEKYVLGGIEILYEKIIEGVKEEGDYLINVYSFMNEYNQRYNEDINNETIYDLCKLASD